MVPGVTNTIVTTASSAMKEAYSKSFSMVFLASISFGGVAIIAAFFVPNISGKLSHEVVRRLEAHGLGAFGSKTKKPETKPGP